MYDVMLDIETTGTDPAHNGILQIAAWKFNYMTGEVGDCIDIPVQTAPGRYWDLSTIQWWREESGALAHMNDLVAKGIPAAQGFQQLFEWVGYSSQKVRLWAKPITFEYPFLESHFRQLGIHMPFHYRYTRDINTHIAALAGDPSFVTFDIDVEFEGQPHNALWDALHDMRCLLRAKELAAEGKLVRKTA
jgi:DNA polymerase III alpha subunit (gram-positive type)